jgi:tRNA threonylcarbamoyl adenosine modification protein (Sua5/YciO/YrdC/YwlC family)
MFLEKTEIYDLDPQNPDQGILKRTAEIILSGGVVVYPTDTLYGFGVDASNPVAMNRLYELKGRDDKKPVSLIIKNINAAESLIGKLDDYEKYIFKKLFPGKFTLVLKKKKKLEVQKLNQFSKIGFRIPHYKICKVLAELTNRPITSTSVNISSKDNLTSIKEIKALFNKKVDIILNVGPLKRSKGSTVIDLAVNVPTILRAGDVSVQELERILDFPVSQKYPEKYIITFVCSGNICRSPMAEAIMKKKIEKSKYSDVVEVGSAGTLNINNSHPTLEALDVAHTAGFDLTKHKSRGLVRSIIQQSNLIICMALDHIHYIQDNFPEYRSRARLLKQMNVERKLSNPSVPDPIGQSLDYYENVFKQISNEIGRVMPEIFKMVDEFLHDTGRKRK